MFDLSYKFTPEQIFIAETVRLVKNRPTWDRAWQFYVHVNDLGRALGDMYLVVDKAEKKRLLVAFDLGLNEASGVHSSREIAELTPAEEQFYASGELVAEMVGAVRAPTPGRTVSYGELDLRKVRRSFSAGFMLD